MKGDWLRRSADGTAVVFVHGVLSSGETCWQNANGTYWPSLLASEINLERTGLYVFTYKTNLFSKTYRLGDAVDALKEHMRLDGVSDCRTLVFVAHSMGGLLVRKLLVERVSEFRDKATSIGLFLVASPSLGSSYADLLEPLARFLGHTQADALRFSQNNAWLMLPALLRIAVRVSREIAVPAFLCYPRRRDTLRVHGDSQSGAFHRVTNLVRLYASEKTQPASSAPASIRSPCAVSLYTGRGMPG